MPYVHPVAVDSDETSDTASSSAEEMSTFFEHSSKIIPHSIVHFADQVIMGGTHKFHDTAPNEASHKECVKLSGERSRIYSDVNLSADNLLKFNMQNDWYQNIFDKTLKETAPTALQPENLDVEHLKHVRLTNGIKEGTAGLNILRGRNLVRRRPQNPTRYWDRILCEGVPVSVRELLSIFADIVGYPVADAHLLLQCSWDLGYHLKSVTSKGVTRNYWGGGVTPKTTTNYLRGDWLETNITDLHNGVVTSRLVRVICGVCVGKLKACDGLTLPDNLFETEENRKANKVHFLLVRYAQRHPLSRGRRGPNHRPICPGLLQDTHCMWEWAKRQATFRRGCLQDGCWWDANKHYFGNTEESQLLRKESEMLAWYDLIQIHDIKSYANIQRDPDKNGSFLQSVMWC